MMLEHEQGKEGICAGECPSDGQLIHTREWIKQINKG